MGGVKLTPMVMRKAWIHKIARRPTSEVTDSGLEYFHGGVMVRNLGVPHLSRTFYVLPPTSN